jgi:hypothetical protein
MPGSWPPLDPPDNSQRHAVPELPDNGPELARLYTEVTLLRERNRDLKRLLESALPHPPEIEPGILYGRFHDDHDGTYEGSIGVSFSRDGDAHVFVSRSKSGTPLRFRTILGGGASPRTRNALVLLALAMKLDADEEKAAKEKRAAQRKGSETHEA